MVITFHTDVRFGRNRCREARNWTTEALEKFNWYNFSHGCPIQANHISRRSKLNNGSSWEIQMVLTFNSNVQFRRITYSETRNWTMEALVKFNGHNFYHWGPIQVYNISIRSKLNIGSSREIQIVITFHTDVRFGRIRCREARNWTTEALEKFKWS